MHTTTFLMTDSTETPESFFQGYCFAGADYIFGQEGLDQFRASTGKDVGAGLDGAYVVAKRTAHGVRFGNDYAGYKVLFYYHDGSVWAVSNSYALIVDHLRGRGVDTIPNYAQLSAISGPGSAHSQLFSFETMTRGVRVLPRACSLLVTKDRVIVERWQNPDRRDYGSGLEAHLETWLSRFETLMLDPRTDFIIDVTGGVDSRTNLALVVRAKERLHGAGSQPRLNCGSTPTDTADLVVAEALTASFGLALNDSRRFAARSLTAAECFATFRELNVGVYYPVYMPVEAPMPGKITIGGGGGEIHRKFYEAHQRSRSPEKFFTSYASTLAHRWLGAEFIRDGRAATMFATGEGVDPLRAHYREFRHRFHVGRAPRYGTAFTPLDSVSADLAQSQAGPERLDEGQFNYDIMASLNSDLLEMPFDSAKKAPSDSVRQRLTRVSTSSEASPGHVWAPEPGARRVRRSAHGRAAALSAAVEASAANPLVREFWGEAMVDEARALTSILVEGRSVGNAVNLKPVSAILAADLCFDGDGGASAVLDE